MTDSTRSTLAGIFADAIAGVDPARAVRDTIDLDGTNLTYGEREFALDDAGRLVVIAFGKAAPAMVRGLADVVGGID
jgi:glycerate-2-kinase